MAGDRNRLRPGARVEIRSSLDRRWGRGFELVSIQGEACTVRRLSDGAVLPAQFRLDQLRPERPRNDMWWFS